jgi:plastocyanin
MRNGIASTILGLAIALTLVAPASAEVRSMTFKYGPMYIGPYQALRSSTYVPTPKLDGFVTEMDAHVIDAKTGEEIPQYQVMLHHVAFTDEARRDGSCPRNDIGERFYGTSEELRRMTLPAGYGYRIGAGDTWRMIWMLMNHLKTDGKVFIEYHVAVDISPRLTPVRPYWVSVVPCVNDPQYSVPGGAIAGSTASRNVTWRIPMSGRIVAMGGHLHGGSRSLTLTQPRCGYRVLHDAVPTYAPPGDPLYTVVPMLHEPDPVNVSWWQSPTGWNVRKGEKLRLSANYDGHYPHMRVMGIMHVYIAEDERAGASACGLKPPDVQVLDGSGVPGGRLAPPPIIVPFEAVGRDGVARPISTPPGTLRRYDGDANVTVADFRYSAANISVPRDVTVRWHFRDSAAHDATLVNGPRGFGTPTVRKGHVESHRFTVPGVYRIYCSIHPVYMSQVVRVRPKR